MSCLFGDSEIGSVIYYKNGQNIEISKVVDSEGEIWSGGSIVYDGLKFTALEDDSSVILTKYRRWTPTNPITIKYSLNGKKWTPYTLGDEIKLSKAGNYVYLCAGDGGNPTFSEDVRGYYYYFQMTGRISASGNIMSLLDNTLQLNALTPYCFGNLFDTCESLVTPPCLPATELASSCYISMFHACTNLTSMPELPAETLYNLCYYKMFSYCSSLVASPILRAKNLASNCYYDMFLNAGNVTSVWMPKIKSYDSNTYGRLSRSHTITINCEQDGLRFTAAEDDCTARLSVSGNTQDDQLVNLEYSINSEKWYSYSFDENGDGISLTLSASGDYALFRAKSSGNETFSTSSITYSFHTSGGQYLSGNIQYLLDNNASRTDAPEYCYHNLFNDCSSLSGEVRLDANTLNDRCYSEMFDGSNIEKAYLINILEDDYNEYRYGVLPQNRQFKYGGLRFSSSSSSFSVALNRAESAGNNIKLDYSLDNGLTWTNYTWNGTSGTVLTVTDGKELMFAATSSNDTISDVGKEYTFAITGNVNADGDIMSLLSKDMEVDSIPDNCFTLLFYNCQTLLSMPKISAKTIGENACELMFSDCASLTGVKTIEADTIEDMGCASMFQNCTSMTDAPIIKATELGGSAIESMFAYCSSLSSITVYFDNWNNYITIGWVLHVAENGVFNCPYTLGTNETITRGNHTCPQNWNVVNYPSYLTFTAEESNSKLSFKWLSGSNVMYRKDDENWKEYNAGTTITLSNIGDYVQFKGKNVITDVDNHFSILNGKISAKNSVTSLTDEIGNNPYVELDDSCYAYMFYYTCVNLMTAPSLPAMLLSNSCYDNMFAGCYKMKALPELPAVTLTKSCYKDMFTECGTVTSTITLPATSLAESCYENMFCWSNLTSAPELPATILSKACYKNMFSNCKDLKTPPELPSTLLAESCYEEMFSECDVLSVATTLPATTLADYCYSGMFSQCKSLTSAPELKAKTMTSHCYSNMFSYCSSLLTAPLLSSTALAEYCYNNMFYYCKKLKISANGGVGSIILNIPKGTTTYTGWNTNMFNNTGGTFTGNPSVGIPYYNYQ